MAWGLFYQLYLRAMGRISNTLHFKPGIENILNSKGTNSELSVIIVKMTNYKIMQWTILLNNFPSCTACLLWGRGSAKRG